mmetsp:Transcript_35287/g.77260  ORF Transcript_35287/g.77260 Transcript_35287/m.77260 type:complete len:89 (+) Transcript_35287:89-355(+)|eukprot:CAMPEP_0204277970 /NCGR_PEP_ID=MMETSP0468-20130131/29607_1 /ASSEMBLY_ACC=CAM_ASM_000383 /TAXON_ID=2969 /ORGANISM="Oxyrrhis marina" /LENGTH=88 /DNA_ID=CAMNT_0051254827 /DNA_START=89 /DNA_END=355 /DNA_ORIENTATION=+
MSRMGASRQLRDVFQRVVTTANSFAEPNYRAYFRRRALQDYRELARQSSPSEEVVKTTVAKMTEHLAMLQRQSIIINMYHLDTIPVKR